MTPNKSFQFIRTVISYRKGKDAASADKRKSDGLRSGSIERLVASIAEMNTELARSKSIAEKLRNEHRALFIISGRRGSGAEAHCLNTIAEKLKVAEQMVHSLGALPTEYSSYVNATISDLDRTRANVGAALANLRSLHGEFEVEYTTVNKQRLRALK